jgi:TPR repeat protein
MLGVVSGRAKRPAAAEPGFLGGLFRLGLLYSTGQGGAPRDYVSAHMLFNLAAMRGSEEAKAYRRELSLEMDPADVAEAQRAARRWLADG